MMEPINSDKQLRAALHGLDPVKRRDVCASLVDNVVAMNTDHRVSQALQAGHNPDTSPSELMAVFKAARAATVDSRTRCGADCNWRDQAAHFVARATAAAVAPEGQCQAADPPWQVVMSCRMARNCELIEADDDSINAENEAQYRIVNDFLSA